MARSSPMFPRIVYRSIRGRWARLVAASVAMVLGALLVAALGSLTLDVGGKVGKELRGYGANIVLAPGGDAVALGTGSLELGSVAQERYLAEADLAVLDDAGVVPDIAGYAPYLYGIVDAGGRQAILAGTHFERVAAVSPWWKVTGQWVSAADTEGAMIGSNVARQLGLDIGESLAVRWQERTRPLVVRGIVDTGAAEDNQVLVNLPVAQELLDKRGAVALVEVSALTASSSLASTVAAIERAIPAARVKIIGQIADAEAAVFSKIQLLMVLVAALVLLAAALSVSGTMTATVLERTREIGLLKALGAGERRIAQIFLAEAAMIGICGGLVGYVVGVFVAKGIAQSVFGMELAPQWVTLPATVMVALAVAILASLGPVRRAMNVDPAVTLRGE